jgi:hypothetical protein
MDHSICCSAMEVGVWWTRTVAAVPLPVQEAVVSELLQQAFGSAPSSSDSSSSSSSGCICQHSGLRCAAEGVADCMKGSTRACKQKWCWDCDLQAHRSDLGRPRFSSAHKAASQLTQLSYPSGPLPAAALNLDLPLSLFLDQRRWQQLLAAFSSAEPVTDGSHVGVTGSVQLIRLL